MASLRESKESESGPRDRARARSITLSLSRGSVTLRRNHVDLLVRSLRELGSPDGNLVADEVEDLALAGVRIDLRLNAGELDAFASAVVSLGGPTRQVDPAFSRLLAYVREEEAR